VAAGSSPVVPASWWPWCSGSIRGCEPREAGRENSLHKLDALVAAIRVFREGCVAEFEQYDRRERELVE
jgi:hypothetical protein